MARHFLWRGIKSRSRLNADGGVNLYSSRCMHDLSFMALALIVSEKSVNHKGRST